MKVEPHHCSPRHAPAAVRTLGRSVIMNTRLSKNALIIFALLLVLSFFLTAAAGGAIGWYATMVICACIPVVAGPRIYRALGAVALATSVLLVVADYRAGLKFRERLRAVHQQPAAQPGVTLTNGSRQ